MKINALFIENKANLGKPQFAGYVEQFDDVPEICAYALPNFFKDKQECSTFVKKLRECFDAKGDEEGFFDSILQVRLYGFSNTWKIIKNEIIIYVMKNLVSLDALKPTSGLNEDLSSSDRSKAYKALDDYLKHEVDLTDEEKKLVADAAKHIWDDIYVALWGDLGTMPGFRKEEKTTFEKAISYKKHNDKNFKITKDHLESLVDSINHEDVLEIVPREMIDDEHFIVIGFDTAVL